MVFGPTIKASLLNIARQPMLLVDWLSQPQIVTYLSGLLASAGYLSLLSPLTLAISAPVVAMNVFSAWNWTYSEGAHYSASILPFVVISAIYGLDWIARQVSSRTAISRRHAVDALALVVLAIAGVHHYRIGMSPLAASYHRPRLTDHHRLGHRLMARIPPDAPLSSQSGLYPHLAHREKAYFFPAVNDAEYVLLDVTGSPYPITTREVYQTAQRLMTDDGYGVVAAEDGYLLLKKGVQGRQTRLAGGTIELSPAFYTFVRVDEGAVPHSLRARFGDDLELLGYDYTILNVVHASDLPAILSTYWRPLRPLEEGLGVSLFFSREDGAIVYHFGEATPASIWYPASRWQVGEVIRLETPILTVGRLEEALVAVVSPEGDAWTPQDRLGPVVGIGDPPPAVYDQGTLLGLFALP
jgi:hypothetical protein